MSFFQLFGIKQREWRNWNFDLMMALDEKLGDHQS